jgi:hypothetical protein
LVKTNKKNRTDFSKCQFCGGLPLSKTHIWPKWLAGVVTPKPYHVVKRTDRSGNGTNKFFEKVNNDLFSVQPRIACRNCNSGWMNKIELEVIKFIFPFVGGTWPDEISYENSRALSRWLSLICINAELSSTLWTTIPPFHRKMIMEGSSVPNHWSISIAKTSGEIWKRQRRYENYPQEIHFNQSLSIHGKQRIFFDHTQITTLGIGGIFAQIVTSPNTEIIFRHVNMSNRAQLISLHPNSAGKSISLKKVVTLSDLQIDFFTQRKPWFFDYIKTQISYSGYMSLRNSDCKE